MTTAEKIRHLAADCAREARLQGFDGDRYELTAADCDWITEQIGRKPSRSEWREAGFPNIGSRHVDDSAAAAARALRAIPSQARAAASRENGRKGGRPRKPKA